MYGKYFASTYTGSMVGAGSVVFAVWGFVVANCKDGSVEVNPKLLSMILGETQENIEKALEYLCAPDPNSRSKAEEGRRMVKNGSFLYDVPNHSNYRKILNDDERREYFREKKREQRERDVKTVKDKSKTVKDMSKMSNVSTQAEADSEGEAEELKPPSPPSSGDEAFEEFWKAYPRRKGKGAARIAWKKHKCSSILPQILVSVRSCKISDDWTKEGGRYIPHPATWLNQEGWFDEFTPHAPVNGTRNLPPHPDTLYRNPQE